MLRRRFALTTLLSAACSAAADVEIRGLMDVVAHGHDELRVLNRVNTGDSYIDLLRTKLFVSSGNEQSEVHVQFQLNAKAFKEFRIFGAYLLHRVWEDREYFVEIGQVPLHDGIWANRSYSDKNPLVGLPLAYYWHSTLPYRMMPTDLDQLLSQKGLGQSGVYYADVNGPRGTPYATSTILYDNCWNYGMHVLGKQGRFDGALGLTLGAPASPVTAQDTNDELSLHAKLGYSPVSGVAFHLSYAQGAYLWRDVEAYLPAGTSVNDYQQRLWIASAEAGFGRYLLHGESFWNHYETPLREDGLASFAFYVEGQAKAWAGSYFALRYDEMSFEDVEGSAGTQSWDQNVRRIEFGAGYSISRDLKLKAVVQSFDLGNGFDAENRIPMIQTSLRF